MESGWREGLLRMRIETGEATTGAEQDGPVLLGIEPTFTLIVPEQAVVVAIPSRAATQYNSRQTLRTAGPNPASPVAAQHKHFIRLQTVLLANVLDFRLLGVDSKSCHARSIRIANPDLVSLHRHDLRQTIRQQAVLLSIVRPGLAVVPSQAVVSAGPHHAPGASRETADSVHNVTWGAGVFQHKIGPGAASSDGDRRGNWCGEGARLLRGCAAGGGGDPGGSGAEVQN